MCRFARLVPSRRCTSRSIQSSGTSIFELRPRISTNPIFLRSIPPTWIRRRTIVPLVVRGGRASNCSIDMRNGGVPRMLNIAK